MDTSFDYSDSSVGVLAQSRCKHETGVPAACRNSCVTPEFESDVIIPITT